MVLSTPTVKKDGLDVAEKFDLSKWQAGGITSFSQTCFAEYWDDLPPIVSNADAETSDNEDDDIIAASVASMNITIVDPYNFRHRMAMEKYLIEHTGGESTWGSMSDVQCSRHPRWGYAAQLDWQHRSGRFDDPSKKFITKVTDTISKRSWWGKMNLNFSVAAYCGAAEAGLVPAVSLSEESVSSDDGFQTCVGIWKKYWETGHTAFVAAHSSSKNEEDRLALTLVMYRELWATHTDIIKSSLQQCKDLEAILPKEDRDVGLGWATMVELLAATNWPLLCLDSFL